MAAIKLECVADSTSGYSAGFVGICNKVVYTGKVNGKEDWTFVFKTEGEMRSDPAWYVRRPWYANRPLCNVKYSWLNARQEGRSDVEVFFDGHAIVWAELADPSLGGFIIMSPDASSLTFFQRYKEYSSIMQSSGNFVRKN